MLLPEITLGGSSILILIYIVTAVLKQLGFPSRFLPLITIICGMSLGLGSALTSNMPLVSAVVGGALIGASVSGLYDFGKNTILGK